MISINSQGLFWFTKQTFLLVARRWYQSYTWPRILIFWIISTVSTTAVITVIATDWITWDRLNRDFFATTGLSVDRLKASPIHVP